LWEKRNKKEANWLTYKQIIQESKKYGVSERTTVRYLNTLVSEGKLEKDERGYKKTFYKPTKVFWADIGHNDQQYRINGKSLEPIGKYVMDYLRKTIAETNDIQKDRETNWEKIAELSPGDANDSESFYEVAHLFFKKGKLTRQEKDELFALLNSFKNNLFQSLTNPTVFARIEAESELPCLVENSVWNMIRSYMELWAFIYKHPGGVLELEKYKTKLKAISQTGEIEPKK
jgi:hypothetical protein